MSYNLNLISMMMDNLMDQKSAFNQNIISLLDDCDLTNLDFLRELDNAFVSANHKKYLQSQNIIQYISDTKIPSVLEIKKITFLALLDYFQKKYIFSSFWLDMDLLLGTKFYVENKEKFYINTKLSNFPHLIGIRQLRDSKGRIVCRKKPREFLDGVIYQWIVVDNYGEFEFDLEKLEVFPWIVQTLANPTYIFPKESFNKTYTKINSDLCFVRAALNSEKFSFHLVFLKYQGYGQFAFVSQFALSKKEYYRLKKIFHFEKRIKTKDNWRPR